MHAMCLRKGPGKTTRAMKKRYAGSILEDLIVTSSKLVEYRQDNAATQEALVADDLNLVNKLYYGDNLFIMREYIPDESVDLIYLDPPFNSKATYNVLFHEKDGTDSPAQITAFEDTWHWDMSAESA